MDFDCYGFIMSINYKEMSESGSFVVLLIEEQRWMKEVITDDLAFQQWKLFSNTELLTGKVICYLDRYESFATLWEDC